MASPRHRWDPVAPPPPWARATGAARPARRRRSHTRGGPRVGWRRRARVATSLPRSTATGPSNGSWSRLCGFHAEAPSRAGPACRLHGAAFFDGLLPDGADPAPRPPGDRRRPLRGDAGAGLLRDRHRRPEVVVRSRRPDSARRARALRRHAEPTAARGGRVDGHGGGSATWSRCAGCGPSSPRGPAWRGVRRAARALDLAVELSRSPNETRMRLVWVPRCRAAADRLVNQPVFDRRRTAARHRGPARRGARLVGEYDGADHRSARAAQQRRRSRGRPAPGRARGLPGDRSRPAAHRPGGGADAAARARPWDRRPSARVDA